MATQRSKAGSSFLSLVRDQSGASAEQTAVDGSRVVETGASDLAQLRSGKINLEDYMSLSVSRALAQLEGQIADEQLDAMRTILRDALQQDPQLVALAERVANAS